MSEWIKCTDRNPEVDKGTFIDVLVMAYDEDGFLVPRIACYANSFKSLDGKYKTGFFDKLGYYISVASWLPLPEYPGEQLPGPSDGVASETKLYESIHGIEIDGVPANQIDGAQHGIPEK